MDAITVLPLISSILSLIFGLTVLDQFLARRKPYQLIWAIGLLMYFIGTGCEFWAGKWGLNATVLRVWYLFGAVLVAAYLGMGTLYLVTPRRTANIVLTILLAASVYAAFMVFTANIDLRGFTTLSGEAMPGGIRLMTPVFNTFGTVALVGGAAYSAWVFWKHKLMPYRMISNILIAVGAIMPAAGGTSMRLTGHLTLFYVLELIGIILIFTGFLRSREVFGFYRFPFVHGFHKIGSD
ncbi:MAG: hypothetical protein HYX79_04840 [Chloroflexi bacterium]|nr:hypothetical protein [Chloroflexota bacterium]